MTTARERFFYTRTLCSLLKSLEGVETEIELINESHVKGTVESVSGSMNVTMRNCECIVGGRLRKLQQMLVKGRKIRMVIIPDDIDMVDAMQRVINMYNYKALGRKEFSKTPILKQRGRLKGRGSERGRGKNAKNVMPGMVKATHEGRGRGRGRGRLKSDRGRGYVQRRQKISAVPGDSSYIPVKLQTERGSSVPRYTTESKVSMLHPEYMNRASDVLGNRTERLSADTDNSSDYSHDETVTSQTDLAIQCHKTAYFRSSSKSQALDSTSMSMLTKSEKCVQSGVYSRLSESIGSKPSSARRPALQRRHQDPDAQCGMRDVPCTAASTTSSKSGLASTDLRNKLSRLKLTHSKHEDVMHRDKSEKKRPIHHSSYSRVGEHLLEPFPDSKDQLEVKQNREIKVNKDIRRKYRHHPTYAEDSDLHGCSHYSSDTGSSGSGHVDYEYMYSNRHSRLDRDTDQRQSRWQSPTRNPHSHSGSRLSPSTSRKERGRRTPARTEDLERTSHWNKCRSFAGHADYYSSAGPSSRERIERSHFSPTTSRERPERIERSHFSQAPSRERSDRIERSHFSQAAYSRNRPERTERSHFSQAASSRERLLSKHTSYSRERSRHREKERSISREKHRSFSRERDTPPRYSRERSLSKYTSYSRERSLHREKGRSISREKHRSFSRERDTPPRYSTSRERSLSKHTSYSRERSRHREKERS